MRRILFGLAALVVAVGMGRGPALAHDTGAPHVEPQVERLEYPLEHGKVAIRASGQLKFNGSWSGAQGTRFNPTEVSSAVMVATGSGEGSASIALDATRWKVLPKGKGYRYRGAKGETIRTILVRLRKSGGGTLKIAGKGSWTVSPDATITVNLTIGSARWCSEFGGPFRQTRAATVARSDQPPASCDCAETFTSTWEAIQRAVFERNGCTTAVCHGSAPGQGGLDMRPEVAHQNLVGVPSTSEPGLLRVKGGDRTNSVLFRRLAKAVDPLEYAEVPGTPMPSGLPPISAAELEAVRLWIMNGAPETGIIAGTDQLLSTCLPPPDPIKIARPPAPAADDGVQMYAPPWVIEPRNALGENGEDEVCFATYFDFSGQIPVDHPARIPANHPACAFWNENSPEPRDCFYYKRSELTQDPNSHHSIIHMYRGEYDFGHPDYARFFGPFTCRDGANAGAPCDPLGSADQCPGSTCAGDVRSSVACIGYGPPDLVASVSGSGTSSAPSIGGSQQSYQDQRFPVGVFSTLPLTGTIVWNSHAFNVASEPTTNEQYLNVFFAKQTEERQYLLQGIFDSRFIFTQHVPPFTQREYCATFTLPQGARLFQLSSHTHRFGIRFRTWEPPNDPCAATGGRTDPGCRPDDSRPPTVTSAIYNDPIQYEYAVPLALDGASVRSRTIKYCSLFDNGFTDRSTVKRQSRTPQPPLPFVPGGPCPDDENGLYGVRCLNEGAPLDPDGVPILCGGDDGRCDSSPGAGDGVCDACPVLGGVTTESEMFILLGLYYCPGCG